MSDSLADAIPTYLGGVEKAYVREQCWYPLLLEQKELGGRRIRYLTLPGRQLTELRGLVDRGVLQGPSDVIIVEADLMDYYLILRDAPQLPFEFKVEPIVVLNGDIDVLVTERRLDRYLPVDAINLDYCGFYWGGEAIETRKWQALKRLVELQANSKSDEPLRPFILLLTVQGRGDGSISISDALAEYKEEIGEQWDEIVSLPYHKRLLHALPIMIEHLGFAHHFDVEMTHRYVYQPRSVGGKATMLSFGFKFRQPPDGGSATSRMKPLLSLETERCTSILSSVATHLVYNSDTQQLETKEYGT